MREKIENRNSAKILPLLWGMLVFLLFTATLRAEDPLKTEAASTEDLSARIFEILQKNPEIFRELRHEKKELEILQEVIDLSGALLKKEPEKDLRDWTLDVKLKSLLTIYRTRPVQNYNQLKEVNEITEQLRKNGSYAKNLKDYDFLIYTYELKFLAQNKNGKEGPNPYRLKESIKKYMQENPSPDTDRLVARFVEVAKDYSRTDNKFTVEALQEIGEIYIRNQDPVQGQNLLALARRYELIGQPFLFSGNTVEGKKISSKDYKDKVILVEYWASWCRPCITNLPRIRDIYSTYNSRGFEIVSVNADKNAGDRDRFMEKEKMPWVVLTSDSTVNEQGKRIKTQYGINQYPSFILVDREGKVVATEFYSLPALERELEKLLPEDEKEKSPGKTSPGAIRGNAPVGRSSGAWDPRSHAANGSHSSGYEDVVKSGKQ